MKSTKGHVAALGEEEKKKLGRIQANHKNPSRDGISEPRHEPGTSPLQNKNVTHLTTISRSHVQLKTFYCVRK